MSSRAPSPSPVRRSPPTCSRCRRSWSISTLATSGPSSTHLLHHLGRPTLIIESGGRTPEGDVKLHVWWKLTEPAEGEDLARLCRLRGEIAMKVAGDTHFRSAHQPIRVAGSVYHKGGFQRLVQIREQNPVEVELADFAEMVAEMPALSGAGGTPAAAGRQALARRGAHHAGARGRRRRLVPLRRRQRRHRPLHPPGARGPDHARRRLGGDLRLQRRHAAAELAGGSAEGRGRAALGQAPGEERSAADPVGRARSSPAAHVRLQPRRASRRHHADARGHHCAARADARRASGVGRRAQGRQERLPDQLAGAHGRRRAVPRVHPVAPAAGVLSAGRDPVPLPARTAAGDPARCARHRRRARHLRGHAEAEAPSRRIRAAPRPPRRSATRSPRRPSTSSASIRSATSSTAARMAPARTTTAR